MTNEQRMRYQLARAIIYAIWPEGRKDLLDLGDKAAVAVLPIIERERAAERVRVVEGLVATIKALPTYNRFFANEGTKYAGWQRVLLQTDVLEKVEAAREDTGG